MAIRLSLWLGTSAEFWLGMQVKYDLWQAEQKGCPAIRRIAA
jgi:addiction module HigA family antidote